MFGSAHGFVFQEKSKVGGETCVKVEKTRVRPSWESKMGINSLKGKRFRYGSA